MSSSQMTAVAIVAATMAFASFGALADDTYLVVGVQGGSSLKLGQRVASNRKFAVAAGASVRLVSKREVVVVRGPKSTTVGQPRTGQRANSSIGRTWDRLSSGLKSVTNLTELRGSSDEALPDDPLVLDGNTSGVRCVIGERPVIHAGPHDDSSGLKIVERSTGATGFVFPSDNSPRWLWPDTLKVKDEGKYDLFWSDADRAVTWIARIGAPASSKNALGSFLEKGCTQQAYIALLRMPPDREF
ncbi:MAG: hypothetical protein K0U74_15280 [Alphaproteobacteria bacterium]|nr:hypothetical protein [Alphaproteobacteria bacterium]